ncbi:hypothetical protein BDZ97DRAFT_1928870 [Flammula alnicola]|nr:hypothetical protein BDZ97DRAFT_1928870 [Flammula alnicola]
MASPATFRPIPTASLDALAGALYFSEYTLEQSPLNINDFAREVFHAGLLCEPILVLHLTPDPDARFLDLLKQLVHLQNVARQLANAALFNKLHRFLVHRYVRLLGLSKAEIADFYAEGVAEASTIRSARQVTPFERDPILFNSNHKCRDVFLTDLLRLLE